MTSPARLIKRYFEHCADSPHHLRFAIKPQVSSPADSLCLMVSGRERGGDVWSRKPRETGEERIFSNREFVARIQWEGGRLASDRSVCRRD